MFMHTLAGLHLSFLGFLKHTEHILKPHEIFHRNKKTKKRWNVGKSIGSIKHDTGDNSN